METTNDTNKKAAKLVYPELSYALTGILFDVHNALGNKYQEKHYQRAIEIKLKQLNIPYQREVRTEIDFEGEKLGTFAADFVVDEKVILEVKAVPRLLPNDISQVIRYLKAMELKLGLLANFRTQRLELRRVVN